MEGVRPARAWVGDITSIRLRQDFVYRAVLMDVFTRLIRGWHLGRSLDGALTLTALERALAGYRPVIHHSDQGVPYAATGYVDQLHQVGAQISMAAIGEPRENGYAERLMRTIKKELVHHERYTTRAEAKASIFAYVETFYNRTRRHSSLGFLSPMEFERAHNPNHP